METNPKGTVFVELIAELMDLFKTSVVRSKAANGGQVKSGQRISLESGVLLDVVGCP